jgi:hypothetical protein
MVILQLKELLPELLFRLFIGNLILVPAFYCGVLPKQNPFVFHLQFDRVKALEQVKRMRRLSVLLLDVFYFVLFHFLPPKLGFGHRSLYYKFLMERCERRVFGEFLYLDFLFHW